jgi:hypothetical protein
MSRNQRLIYLAIAAAIALVAVVVLTAGGDDDELQSATVTATPTSTPTPEDGAATRTPEAEEATPEPTPEAPLLRPGEENEIEVVQGDTVRFRVRVDEDDELHVHGYDIEKALTAGKTATVSFKADITGVFEIELHHAQPPLLAQLKVEPR